MWIRKSGRQKRLCAATGLGLPPLVGSAAVTVGSAGMLQTIDACLLSAEARILSTEGCEDISGLYVRVESAIPADLHTKANSAVGALQRLTNVPAQTV